MQIDLAVKQKDKSNVVKFKVKLVKKTLMVHMHVRLKSQEEIALGGLPQGPSARPVPGKWLSSSALLWSQ